MKNLYSSILFFIAALPFTILAQQHAIIDLDQSPYARLKSINLDEVRITGGFWYDRQHLNEEASLEVLWDRATNPIYGYSLNNFRKAAGLMGGKNEGVWWQDAWMYKWIESASYIYAATGRKDLLERMDSVIDIIALAQEPDGYIATQHTAGEFPERWMRPNNHEMYNMGHLLTAGAVHYRFTGSEAMLDIAKKTAAYCLKEFREKPEVMWEYPHNPSIIMGAVELYRVTRDPENLELAKHIVDLRGSTNKQSPGFPNWGKTEWGSLDSYMGGNHLTQNYKPLREETEVLGHAVFFTYLFAGATDVFMETGDSSLLVALDRLWDDLTTKKMYITGGISPEHKAIVSREFTEGHRQFIQYEPIHEGIAVPYELPNAHAYNETCGMIGNMMWNWRMLQATGNPKYADIMELSWYNSILTGVALDGNSWSYTNPLRWYAEDHELWSHDYHARHVPGKRHICCPTNVLRNIAMYQGYLFSQSKDTLWLQHYAEAELDLLDKEIGLKIIERTNYPWEEDILLEIAGVTSESSKTLMVRIPEWANNPTITVNSQTLKTEIFPDGYVPVTKEWKEGDLIHICLPMDTKLYTGNHLTENVANQVAVKRGPIVYCLETIDVNRNVDVQDIYLRHDTRFSFKFMPDLLTGVNVLQCKALLKTNEPAAEFGQYYAIDQEDFEEIDITLIPYFSWLNRKESQMTVWFPVR